ncbi:LacI family transcriptional regulator [Paenibacillus antri]|uniref:LacI family transcriptional regulator n=1 Tax=Paenibacillus antri TaxID=2582848 RepID=A0A5R9G7K8_9BACL|nr:LacI family DNA-binding transcriptional regulator [Paenibacillus antri]TLS51059.1 LacI family transcriptional regulator [Paenibacillus antri]
MPTLKDIALQVGVSISTVSRVLNNDSSRHISQETKVRVIKTAKALGYLAGEAPAAAPVEPYKRTPRAAAFRQVGCIVSVPQNKYNHPYFSPILAGVEKKLTELNCVLSYVIPIEELRGETVLRKLVQDAKLDGIILIERIPEEAYEAVKSIVPVVVGIDVSDPTIPVVMYDRVGAAGAAVQHLIDRGHRRIAFIGGAGLTGDMEREKRYRGYRFAMQEAGLDIDPRWIANTEWDVNVSFERMSDMMRLPPDERPTAVFAASDMMGISAMRAAAEMGLRIPEDVAFVGLDNIEISQYTSPPLSTVHIPKTEMGEMAAKVLVDQMNGDHPLPFKLLMPHRLIVRQSSDATRIR